MNKQMDIFQEYCSIISHPLTSLVSGMNIITGANLVALFPDLELFNCTSYKLLNRGSLEGIQSISRYIMFRSRISPFPMQTSSAYNIMVKVVDIFRNDTSHILGVKAE